MEDRSRSSSPRAKTEKEAKATESVVMKIEIGNSDVVGNVRNCLRSRFQKVVVVATDETALEKVDRELATAGLIVPGRVQIVLRKGSAI